MVSAFSTRIDRAYAAAEACASEMIDDMRRPISFVGCGGWQRISMMLVQIGASEASIRVRLPHHALQSTTLPRKSIVIHRVESAWDPAMPDVPGFLIAIVPGWIASNRGFEQAFNPQLSSDVEWTDDQREAWARLRKHLPKRKSPRKREIHTAPKQRNNGYVNSGW